MRFGQQTGNSGAKARAYLAWLSLLAVVMLSAACGADPASEQRATDTPAPTVTSLVIGQATAAPTPTPENNVITLSVWWPETLAPVGRGDVATLLDAQIAAFAESQGEAVEIEFRRKRAQDVGGILLALRSASAVAPDARPDVTLLRRSDLLSAAQEDLIAPVEGVAAAAVISQLYDVALELGQIDDELYGLAYMMDVLHLIYRVPETTEDDDDALSQDRPRLGWSFEDVLGRGDPFVFPAQRSSGINSTFLLQYMVAGGSSPSSTGEMSIDVQALRTVLEFYEEALEDGVISDTVLNYSAPGNYQVDLETGIITSAVVRSDLYLSLLSSGESWLAAPVPTTSGEMATFANAWMWVIVTDDPVRRELAIDFINWMMDADRQSELAPLVYMLPAREDALQTVDSTMDMQTMHALLTNAQVALPENAGGATARAMQTALQNVLTGVRTAQEATQDVLNQVGN
jgi:ABC-type glycerol-3-phosphate transport system substrate-binding protein